MKKNLLMLAAAALLNIGAADAQINQNKCKFLGNITTRGQIEPNVGGLKYANLWDQLTPENESKWGSIANKKVSSVQEAISSWNWGSCDREYNWCKQNGVMFKFHVLIWTSQFPSYLLNLSNSEIRQQIEIWFQAVAQKYPDLQVMDVVNEALPGHAENSNEKGDVFKPKLIDALGGKGSSGYDWIIEAFKLARKYFPNTVLVYNDYNTFTWQKDEFIDLVSKLVKGGAPIDGYGHQSHDLDDYYKYKDITKFGSTLKEIHDGITQKGGRELQCYITEYDISQGDDNTFVKIMENTFKPMWEADYVSGITLWGFVNGATWRDNTGLVTSTGADRKGMIWLRDYMASSTGKGATAKFCGKNAGGNSLQIEIATAKIILGEEVSLSLISGNESGIKNATLYINDKKFMESKDGNFKWTPEEAGTYTLKVDVTYNDGEELSAPSNLIVMEPNKPYGGTAAVIPGKIEAENYDEGYPGLAYYDKSEGNSCDNVTNFYRKDDVDLKEITNGVAVGSFQGEEWLSYTVNVKEDGEYYVTMRLGEGNDSGSLSVSFDKSDSKQEVKINKIGDWGEFKEVSLEKMTLVEGIQNMVIKNTGDWIDIDWIKFEKVGGAGVEATENTPIAVVPNPASSMIEITGTTPTSVEIISATGAVVKKSTDKVLNISDLTSGNYMVRIVTENTVMIKKLIVEK
ncbi:MAG: endo-1,4-beta-xylanase [Paludibacteraceae bacterium]|nr:endo-1,4-beta-xylanase [Candidatus Physcocola equi]MCQ2234362.1 endo-1,4-beta-xylanase [Paludibacteraceae bacterium]